MTRLLLPVLASLLAADVALSMSLRADVGLTPDPHPGASQLLGKFVPLPSSPLPGTSPSSPVDGLQECTREFDDKCGGQMEAVKDAAMAMNVPKLLSSAAGLVACVGENAEDLWKHCRPEEGNNKKVALPSPAVWAARTGSIAPLLASPTVEDKSKCHQEWREECGKQADRLREAVQNADVAGVVTACVKVVECAHEHMDELRKKCMPSQVENQAAAKPVVTAVFVPPPPPQVVTLNTAVLEQARPAIESAAQFVEAPVVVEGQAGGLVLPPVTGVRECTKEFDDKCGKNLEELKDAVLSLDVVRLLHASLGLMACSAENGQDIWEHCKPGMDQNGAAATVIPTLDEVELQKRTLAKLLGPSFHHSHGGPMGAMKRVFSKVSSFVSGNRHSGKHHDEGINAESSAASPPQATMALNMVHHSQRMTREPEPEVPMDAPMVSGMTPEQPLQESKCKEEWEEDCGDKVENLKKRAEEGDVMGILAGAVGVVQCAAEHIQSLQEKCRPFASRRHHLHNHGDREPMVAAWSYHHSPPPAEFMTVVQRQSGDCYDVVLSVCGAQVSAIQTTDIVTSAQLDALESCLLESLPKIEALCAQRAAYPMSHNHHWGGGYGNGGSGCLHRAMRKHSRLLHGLFAAVFAMLGFVFVRRVVKRAYRCHQGECCNTASAVSAKKAAASEASYEPLVEKGEVGPNAV